jgi:hypothetical protein
MGLSIFDSEDHCRAVLDGVTSENSKEVFSFEMNPSMGSVKLTNPKNRHFCWWTHHVDFTPPPDGEVIS